MKKNTMTVPAMALAVQPGGGGDAGDMSAAAAGSPGGDGSGDAGVMPQVGDTVEFTVSGTVSAIENGLAQIEPETVNGAPIDGAGDGSEEQTIQNQDDAGAGGSDDMESHLRKLAATHDDDEGKGY